MQFDNYTIRLLSSSDLHPYFQLIENNRKRLEDFFTGTVSRTRTIEDTKIFLKEVEERIVARTYFPYIIIDTSTHAIIGFLDLKNIDWNIPKAETGSYIDEAYAGKNITTKAFSLFCEFAFKEFGFKKLFLRTHQSNIAAQKVAEKCGFEVEGHIRRDYKTTAGELVDLIYYGKLNN